MNQNTGLKGFTLVLSALVLVVFSGLASAKEKISFMTFFYAPASAAVEDEIIRLFEEAHPDIEVEKIPVTTGSSMVWEKAAIMAAGGAAPDVVIVSLNQGLSARNSGMLLDLRPYVQADLFDMDRFRPGWQLATGPDSAWGGKIYGMPYALGFDNIFYNRDLFRAAGLAEPYKGWTTEEWITSAKRLTRVDGDGKIQVAGSHPPELYYAPWLFSDGGRVVKEGTNELNMDDPRIATGLEFIRKVNSDYNITAWTDFQGQTAAMTLQWDSYVGKLLQNPSVNFDWGVTWAPRGPDTDQPVSYGQGHTMAIMKGSKHPKAAWEFVKFYYSDAAQDVLAQHFLYPMTINGMRSVSRLMQFEAPLDKDLILKPYSDVGDLRTMPWWVPGFTDTFDQDRKLFSQVLDGEMSINAWIDRFKHDFNVTAAEYE